MPWPAHLAGCPGLLVGHYASCTASPVLPKGRPGASRYGVQANWPSGPLFQSRYAALDAHAAVLIFRGLQQLNPAFAAPSGLDPYAFSVLLPPPAPHHKRHWSEAEPSTSGRDKDGGDDGSAGGSSSSGGGGGGGGIGASGPSTGSAGGGSSGVDGMEEDSGGRADGADTWGCQLQQPAQPQLALQPEAEATSLLPPLVAELLRQHSLAASSVVPLQPVPQGEMLLG